MTGDPFWPSIGCQMCKRIPCICHYVNIPSQSPQPLPDDFPFPAPQFIPVPPYQPLPPPVCTGSGHPAADTTNYPPDLTKGACGICFREYPVVPGTRTMSTHPFFPPPFITGMTVKVTEG